jgi:hypothetical protein
LGDIILPAKIIGSILCFVKDVFVFLLHFTLKRDVLPEECFLMDDEKIPFML